MKFLLDAQMPESLAVYFPGHDVLHTTKLAEGNLTTDKSINAISIEEKRVLVTKDSDFYHSYVASQQPYKLVLVKLGNMRLKDLKSFFERNAIKIIELMQDHSFIILEPEKIRVLE
jgi:predicted nuclease of predicted toxin-antitoxin system